MNTIEHQRPSGRRPEGLCHSISSSVGVRLHAEWQNVGTSVPLLARDLVLFASDQDVALALEVSQGYVYHRHVTDGLPSGNRYRTACLRRIVTFSQTGAT